MDARRPTILTVVALLAVSALAVTTAAGGAAYEQGTTDVREGAQNYSLTVDASEAVRGSNMTVFTRYTDDVDQAVNLTLKVDKPAGWETVDTTTGTSATVESYVTNATTVFDVDEPVSSSFEAGITLHVTEATVPGNYTVTVTAVVDGQPVASNTITVTVEAMTMTTTSTTTTTTTTTTAATTTTTTDGDGGGGTPGFGVGVAAVAVVLVTALAARRSE